MTGSPPNDTAMEAALIGGVLSDPAALDEVLSTGLAAEAFHAPASRHAFDAICALAARGEPVDTLTAAAELRAREQARPSADALQSWITRAPAPDALLAYAIRIRDLGRQRALIGVGHEIAALGTTPTTDIEGALDEAERLLLEVTSDGREETAPALAVETVDELLCQIRARQDGTAALPVSTGSVDLDRQLLGGFRPGQLVVVGARPSMGKTAFVLGMTVAAAKRDIPTLFFSLEMSRAEVAQRFLAMEGVPTDQQASGLSPGGWELAAAARDRMKTWPLRIDDDAAVTALTIRSRARRMLAREGLGLVVIDYLQLVSHRQTENRQTQVAEISRELKRIARELSVPVVAVSQLSRNLEAREDKVPRMSDLRESGQLEQDADAVVFLHRPEVYDNEAEPGLAQVIVAKHRNGPTGVIHLTWLPQRMRFADRASLRREPPP
ncbi:MAG: replicative DNA helicase [Acidimicrobiales bacterium]